MSKYTQLLELIRNRTDQSQDPLKIVFEPSGGDKEVLEACGVKYKEPTEGISIDLSKEIQGFWIFKNKASGLRYLGLEDFSSDIIVVEESHNGKDLIYENGKSESKFFENVLYFHKFKSLIIESKIASYYDELNENMIFLSATHGRLDTSCTITWFEEFYDYDNQLENQFKLIQKKINEDDQFKDFLKESFVECVTNLSDEKTLLKSLEKIKHIVESASRNYELYRHKFSFAEFKKQLDEEKEKYFKEYQSNLSDFLSKTASMPIQIGVYIFLIDRFSGNGWLMAVTFILIAGWSYFTVFCIDQILDNIKYLKDQFKIKFCKMLDESGINKMEVKENEEQINKKFVNSINLMTRYKWIIIVFSICALFFCVYFILPHL